MIGKIPSVLALIIALALAGTLSAEQVYKWIDEDGNVHYSDLPVAGAELVTVQSRPTDSDLVKNEQQAVADYEVERAERQEAAAAQAEATAEKRAADKERQANCAKYTERQVRFTENRRIYRMDENGERVYYDEEEMAAARANVADMVAKYCN
jgi:hypothetical protein